MSVDYEKIKFFCDYLEYYPEADEEGYDGIHDGGIKGIQENAPEEAKKAYNEYAQEKENAQKNGIKL